MGRRIAAVALAITALAGADRTQAEPQAVTVEQVLSDPTLYVGKEVRVHGFATIEFENNRLWRDEAAFRNYDKEHAIPIRAADLSPSKRDEVKGRLVYLTGKLNAERWGKSYLTWIDVAEVDRDPADKGPDRGWWSDPEFGKLLGVLTPLAIVALLLGLGGPRPLLRTQWKPATPRKLQATTPARRSPKR